MSGVHYGLLAMSIKWENRIPKVSKPRFSTEDDTSNIETCFANLNVISRFVPQYQFLAEILKWRAQTMPDHVLFTLMNAKVSNYVLERFWWKVNQLSESLVRANVNSVVNRWESK